MKLTLRHEVIKALLQFAAEKDLRYYLNGVFVDATRPGPVALVATDGYVLLALPVEPEGIEARQEGAWIVPRELFEAVKPIKANKTALPITVHLGEGENPDVSVQGLTTAAGKAIDGQYPDWRRVIPATTTGEAAQFDPRLIARLSAACKALDVDVPHIHHNGTGPAVVGGLAGGLAIVMPWRTGTSFETPTLTVPDWARKAS